MSEKDFIKLCKETVINYVNEHIDKTDNKKITEENVFTVWMCKIRQSRKICP